MGMIEIVLVGLGIWVVMQIVVWASVRYLAGRTRTPREAAGGRR